ncbi:MAG: hypothetical protein JO117_05375 [Verrucomicrobia bacterium]|nr:hypothetical protein [Verrucomicrobiota bacterium]
MRNVLRPMLLICLPFLPAAMLLSSCAGTNSSGAVVSRTPGGAADDTPAITSPAGVTNGMGTGIGASVGGNGLGGGRGSF